MSDSSGTVAELDSGFRRQYPNAVAESELQSFRDNWRREIETIRIQPQESVHDPFAIFDRARVEALQRLAEAQAAETPSEFILLVDESVREYTEGSRASQACPLTRYDLYASTTASDCPPLAPAHERLKCMICLELKSHPVVYVFRSGAHVSR
jgi:hypothetical protein